MPRGLNLTDDNETILVRLAALRAASPPALYALSDLKTSERAFQLRMANLCRKGFIERNHLEGRRVAYTITNEARNKSKRIRQMVTSQRLDVSAVSMVQGWWASEMWRLLVEDGWTVGTDPKALMTVRRFLLDRFRKQAATKNDRFLNASVKAMEESPRLWPPATFQCAQCSRTATKRPCGHCGGAKLDTVLLPTVKRCRRCQYRGDDARQLCLQPGAAKGRR